jgi:ammonium transporter, Amt family
LLAYWVFQYAFADTCSTVTSGAMIGRCDFIGDLLYSVGVTGFIYPIIGHWAWGPDGWLAVQFGTGANSIGAPVAENSAAEFENHENGDRPASRGKPDPAMVK